jgi:FPC/CPF motif-containing protein YcgG
MAKRKKKSIPDANSLRIAVVGSLRRLSKAAQTAAEAIEASTIKKNEDGEQLSFKDMFDEVRPHAKELFSFGMVYSALKRAASGRK